MSAPTKSPAISHGETVLCALAGVLIGMGIYMHWMAGFSGDRNWLLLIAHMMADGRALYGNIIEVNPPLILWIYSLPVAISRHTGLQDYHVLVALGLGMVALSICVSVRLIQLHPAFAGNAAKQMQFALLLAFVFIFLTNLFYFCDREHILLVLTFPYVLRLMPSLDNAQLPARFKTLIGLMAGLGFCIKPHTLVVFLGLQAIFILRTRSLAGLFRQENKIIYVAGILYISAVAYFMPDYYRVVLPMALATYSVFKKHMGGLMHLTAAFLIFAMAFADFRRRHGSPYRRDIYYLLQVSLCWLVYAQLNNGWGYAYNPLISTLLILTGFILWEHMYLKAQQAQAEAVKSFTQGIYACLFSFAANAVFVLAGYGILLTYSCEQMPSCKESNMLLAAVKDTRVHSYGTMIMRFSLLPEIFRETGMQPATRFYHFWMLPKFFMADSRFTEEHHWILDYVGHGLAEDMNQRQPELMLVDTSPQFFGMDKSLNFPLFFSAYPDFKEAWSHYHYVRTVDFCKLSQGKPIGSSCKFDFYLRNEIKRERL